MGHYFNNNCYSTICYEQTILVIDAWDKENVWDGQVAKSYYRPRNWHQNKSLQH